MDKDDKNMDHLLRDKFKDFGANPSPDLWSKIDNEINKPSKNRWFLFPIYFTIMTLGLFMAEWSFIYFNNKITGIDKDSKQGIKTIENDEMEKSLVVDKSNSSGKTNNKEITTNYSNNSAEKEINKNSEFNKKTIPNNFEELVKATDTETVLNAKKNIENKNNRINKELSSNNKQIAFSEDNNRIEGNRSKRNKESSNNYLKATNKEIKKKFTTSLDTLISTSISLKDKKYKEENLNIGQANDTLLSTKNNKLNLTSDKNKYHAPTHNFIKNESDDINKNKVGNTNANTLFKKEKSENIQYKNGANVLHGADSIGKNNVAIKELDSDNALNKDDLLSFNNNPLPIHDKNDKANLSTISADTTFNTLALHDLIDNKSLCINSDTLKNDLIKKDTADISPEISQTNKSQKKGMGRKKSGENKYSLSLYFSPEKQINQQTLYTPELGYCGGLNLNYQVSNKVSFSIGLLIIDLRYKLTKFENHRNWPDTSSTTKLEVYDKINFTYLGLPVGLNYKTGDKKLYLLSSIGIAPLYQINSRDVINPADTTLVNRRFNLLLMAGLGINYEVSEKFTLFIEPKIKFFLLNTYKSDYYNNNPLLIGMQIGFRFKF